MEDEFLESFERASADLEMLCAAYPDEITFEGGEENVDGEEQQTVQVSWFPLIFTLSLGCACANHRQDGSRFGATITMEFPKGKELTKKMRFNSNYALVQ